ncbi:MAG TPA: hypothetical protein PLE74_08995 [Candidatus Cloacimonadota bacterium]|nr:hypothetical protein [Candidatus Cloacimonadota bacterium]
MKAYTIMLLLAVLLLSACTANRTNSTPTNKSIGYVHIQGNTSGVDVFINGKAKTVKFDKTTHTALIELAPGDYQIEIQRNGMDLVNENINVSTSNTTEVIIP